MPRPGFVLEVDERTPPLLVNEGEGFRMQRFPLGTKVIYPPDALPGYMRLVPPSSAWRNEFPARGLLTVPLYRPIAYAARVRAPALIVVADGDSVCPPEAMARAAACMPNARLVRLPIGHFDVYAGEVFEQVVRIEVEFLAHHLLAG